MIKKSAENKEFSNELMKKLRTKFFVLVSNYGLHILHDKRRVCEVLNY